MENTTKYFLDHGGYCRKCHYEYYQKPWKERNPEKERIWRKNSRENKPYGMSNMGIKDLFFFQDGKCAICKRQLSLTRPRGYTQDHDHETGNHRGLLCNKCNIGLGMFLDNLKTVQNAAKYLEKWGLLQKSRDDDEKLHDILQRFTGRPVIITATQP